MRIYTPVAKAMPANVRPVSMKRLSHLRLNWFSVGCIFGIGLSFFLNFVFMIIVASEYETTKQVVSRESAVISQTVNKTENTENNPQTLTSLPTNDSPPATAPSYPVTLAIKVTKGDTLLDLLISNRVQSSEAHAVIAALRSKFNPQQLRIGQKISVTLARHETLGDKAAVKELAIKLPNLSTIELQRLRSGGFNVASTEETNAQKTFRGFGKVRTSLFQAGADGNIPGSAMRELVKAFSYDIDFQREIHPGDTVEVLMDRKPAKKGGYNNAGGTLRYAALTLKDGKHEIFRFKDAYGDYAWFDGKGNSIKKSLLRTPVDAVHITSGFGLRTHPIMGYTKIHRGVDFGAETGTPIMAAGDGVVSFKGWKSGYGNFVAIKHNDKYETAYGHCSRFAKIAVGSRVKQGQVIAFVGMTGMATGPHLHYEVHENEQQVNPVAKQFNMAAGLTGKSLAAFKTARQSALNELTSLDKGAKLLASR